MIDGPAKTGRLPDGRFAPGNRANPSGRKQGSRNSASLLAERLMQADAEAIVAAVTTAARAGDMRAAKIALDRTCPPQKDRLVAFDLPPIKSAADAVSAASTIIAAVARGELTPGEAGDVARLVEMFVRAVEAHDLAQRVEALERKGAAP